MTTELYILLKVKGEYSHTRTERWIFSRLPKLNEFQEYEAVYDCKSENLIEARGRTHTDDGWQLQAHKRDLFLTPYGEKRLNQLVAEYMNGYRKKILACAKIALELFAAVAGILAFLLK
jgi:hypothetical protein